MQVFHLIFVALEAVRIGLIVFRVVLLLACVFALVLAIRHLALKHEASK